MPGLANLRAMEHREALDIERYQTHGIVEFAKDMSIDVVMQNPRQQLHRALLAALLDTDARLEMSA